MRGNARLQATSRRCLSTRSTLRCLARRVQHLTDEIKTHDSADPAPPERCRPTTHRSTRHRRHRSGVLHRVVPSWSLPKRSSVRTSRRCRSTPGDLRPRTDSASTQPIRRSSTEPRALHRRHDPLALPPGHHRLPGSATSRRSNRSRDHPVRQALHRPPSLAAPRAPQRTRNHHLTNIEDSPRLGRSAALGVSEFASLWTTKCAARMGASPPDVHGRQLARCPHAVTSTGVPMMVSGSDNTSMKCSMSSAEMPCATRPSWT